MKRLIGLKSQRQYLEGLGKLLPLILILGFAQTAGAKRSDIWVIGRVVDNANQSMVGLKIVFQPVEGSDDDVVENDTKTVQEGYFSIGYLYEATYYVQIYDQDSNRLYNERKTLTESVDLGTIQLP